NGFQYYFGSSSTGGFRCFSAGAAGVDGIMLRTLMGGDVTIPGGAPAGVTTHVVWVHDSTVPEVRGYLNGVLAVTVPQTTPGSGVNGTAADFIVMNYTTNMLVGTAMDDFRFYRRAISAAEVAAWANCGGGGSSIPTFCDPANNNSTGVPTSISGSMGSGVGSGLHLEARQGPAGQFGYFLVGTSFSDPGIPISGGTLCVSGGIGRFNVGGNGSQLNSIGVFNAAGTLENMVGTALSTGALATGFDVPAMLPFAGSPAIVAGSTWYFQLWHQEAGGQSNFSQGLAVTF
ncbi:MAG TPA: hypothetical protein PLJ12_14905, partial [Planctomycetota bacterium]|nr:hypothetical protein [Planctomycetota bacterium]